MKINYRFCKLCGTVNYNIENHHVFFRSQVKPLENCKVNQIDLCHDCHTNAHNDFLTDYKLKIKLLNYFELIFCEQSFTLEEIQKALGINYNASYRLSKNLKSEKGKYTRDSLLLALQGGESIQARYEQWIKGKIRGENY